MTKYQSITERIAITLSEIEVFLLRLVERASSGRRQYRTTTNGSSKWNAGHTAGCVFYAPPETCICDQFR